ncbi:MAG: RraA family protein [Acidobacteriota bacterium]|nr:MAG: RraA family protein [Acidobacteriota bacterium]
MTAVERLARLDACAVSDALDKLGERGTVNGIRSLTGPAKIAGRVVTVKLIASEGAMSKRHLCTAAIEAAAPGNVIVVEHHARDDCAGWGGILSTAAKQRGIAGTIVDGLARDIDESREAGYPVFARAATPSTARGRIVEDDWNMPVIIGGVDVCPGDLVIADGSGVVFVGADLENYVLEAAEAIAAREQAMAKALRDGKRVSQVMGGDYEKMLGDDENG